VKLSRKLGKLVSREGYRRGWRRAQRSIFRLPFGPVLAGIDRNRLRKIAQRYAGAKYADVDHWLRVNRERVQDLKLHRAPPQRVLDLGCGGGFFLFILKRLNHSVLGLDVDRSQLFSEIKPFEPLPDLRQQFDWITAFSIGFDRYPETRARWGVKEWDFLLRDLQRQLAPRGKIYLTVNPLADGSYLAPDVREFFRARGASIERERIFFKQGVHP
jgi:SAM-dependent methyltransferase